MRKWLLLVGLVPLALGLFPAGAGADGSSETVSCTLTPGNDSCGADALCDGFRRICVPVCTDENCCADVSCPVGTACVPGRGTCGARAGPACFDLVPGRSTAATEGAALAPPQRVDFLLHNRSGAVLYFDATSAAPLPRFDLYAEDDGGRRLEIPENLFCPTPCPAEGPVPEIDCARPEPGAAVLADGSDLLLSWSGNEAVNQLRTCEAQPLSACTLETPARRGRYIVEFCAFAAIQSEPVDPSTARFLRGSTVTGPDRCLRATFDYPGQTAVTVTFGD